VGWSLTPLLSNRRPPEKEAFRRAMLFLQRHVTGGIAMDLSTYARGLLLGLSIAAPVGPIGVLCIRRTLTQGWRIGFLTGLGAATADATYGAIAAFGLTALSSLLVAEQFWLRLIGGLFLCYLGARTFVAKPAPVAANVTANSLAGAYASTLLLTLTNPLTILSFAAIFAGFGVANGGSTLAAGVLVAGVFTGSALWWLLLSGGVTLVRSRFRPEALIWVNRLSGTVIFVFGLLALASSVPLPR
jgi:threonine/homoserine/homoserine lactone efflux protein